MKFKDNMIGVVLLTIAVTIGLGTIITKAAVDSGVLIYGQFSPQPSGINVPVRIGAGPDNSNNTSGINKMMVIPCLANTSAPTWSDGKNVPCSVDTSGNIRVIGSFSMSASTSGGASPCYFAATASTNAGSCKSTPGQVYGYTLVNTTATTYYLRMYNLATSPTCSSSTGYIMSIPMLPIGGVSRDIAVGEVYSTGIALCITGGSSSTDNSNAAVGVYVIIHTK